MTKLKSVSRALAFSRKTKETSIEVEGLLDGSRQVDVRTGIGMLDHLVGSFAFHCGWDLKLHCSGDLHIDDHHTAEDCALALGGSLDKALADRKHIRRFGYAYAPLDEALARVVVDFSGRPCGVVSLGLRREMIGTLAAENASHFLQSLAVAARCALHVDVIRGDNDHHRVEAAFKAMALAFRQALAIADDARVASTKGVLG